MIAAPLLAEPDDTRDSAVSHRVMLWILALLTVIGFLIRFSFWDLTIYNLDEAYLTIFATKVAHLGDGAIIDFPLTGIRTSFGFRNPPFFIYMMAPFFAVTSNPKFAMFGLICLGTAAIPLISFSAYQLMGKRAAILAAIVVAFSPNAVQHCRQLWGHDTIIFFGALTIATAVLCYKENRARWGGVSAASALFAMACHLSGITLLAFPLFLIWQLPRRSKLKLIVGIIGILLFLYVPWFLHELGIFLPEPRADGNFPSLRNLWALVTGNGNVAPVETPVSPIVGWFGVLADGYRLDILGNVYSESLYQAPLVGANIFLLQMGSVILFIAGLISLLMRAITLRKNDSAKDLRNWGLLIVIAGTLPLIIFGLLPISSVPLYQLPAFVPAVLGLVYGADKGIETLAIRVKSHSVASVRRVVVGAVGVLMIWSGGIYAFRVYHVVDNGDWNVECATLYRHKMNSIILITQISSDLEELTDYTIMQDGRSPNAGIDVWIGALHYVHTGKRDNPMNPEALQAFVIVDNKTVLRPELQSYLNTRDATPVGTLKVYRLVGPFKKEWEALTIAFPSTRPGEM